MNGKVRANRRAAGADGEDFAASVLEKEGYTILCRNYAGKHGEIDIIAEKNAYIVFVEVKMRKILTQNPAEAVTSEKMLHIVNTAHEFLCEYRDNTYIASLKPRVDVLEICAAGDAPVSYRHRIGVSAIKTFDF
ncbi:MAG: YraN family protein [Eubacteriales bacterium]